MNRVWYETNEGATAGSSFNGDLTTYQSSAEPSPPHHFSGAFADVVDKTDSGYLDAVGDAVADLLVLGQSLKTAMEGMHDIMADSEASSGD